MKTYRWCYPWANLPDPSQEFVKHDDHAAALAEKESEIERLEAWKREAIAVFESAKLHEVGKALDVPLGGCIASAILPGIESLKENLAAERAKVRELVECLSNVRALQEAIMNDRQSDLEFQHEQRCLARHAESLLRINTKALIEKCKGGTE